MHKSNVHVNTFLGALLKLMKEYGIIKNKVSGEIVIRIEKGGIAWVTTNYKETYKRVT